MEVDDLIKEMKEVKAANTSLSIEDVLRIFNIQAIINLTNVIQTK